MSTRLGRAAALCGAAALALWSCGPSDEERAAQARVAAWQAVETEHQALAAARAQLRDLQARAKSGAAPAEGQTEEGQTAQGASAALEQEIAAASDAVNAQIESFMPKLVAYINDDPVVVGEQPTAEQAAALRMKSDEDIELATEYMEQGGDYRRAIEILEKTAEADPNYPALEQKLARAREFRFTSKERFERIEKDMTQDAVRTVLGQVLHRNVREYAEQKAIAWFYPRDPEIDGPGAAAAVFFKQNKAGAWLVYQTQWEAVKGGTREASG